MLLLVGVVLVMTAEGVGAHGMMVEPIQRSSMWSDPRFYEVAEVNYNDNELFCGGFVRQWEDNHGKCGTCGDPYDVGPPRPNEAGGKYAKGIIVETYKQGQVINATVRITANHQGYFVFRLCPNNDVKKRVTQSCLDQNVLSVAEREPAGPMSNKYYIGTFKGDKKLLLQLPKDVTCTQCVLQWTYTTGNNWGLCGDGTAGLGCGPQETFVNCADIAITPSDHRQGVVGGSTTASMSPTTVRTTAAKPPTSGAPATTTTTTTTTTPATSASTADRRQQRCVGAGAYVNVPGIDWWCVNNCAFGFCPKTHCVCS